MSMIININIINNIIHIFLRLLTAGLVGKMRDRAGEGREPAVRGRAARQKGRKNRGFYKLYVSIKTLTITPVKFCCDVMSIIILMSMIININIINKIKINNIIHIFNIIIINIINCYYF